MTEPKVSYFICGAAKCGTRLLVSVLEASGQVDTPRRYGEPNFFTMRPELGLDWYHGLFEKKALMLRAESSPTYMFKGRQAAERILDYNPDARFIFILRDPVARAWSHYWHNRRKGTEQLPPLQAFQAEDERTKASESARYRYSYVGRGRYYRQLSEFRDVAGRERMHVILFENYVADPETNHALMHEFLHMPAAVSLPVEAARKRVNSGGMPIFLKAHHLLARHKREFWYSELTRQLWTGLNYLSMNKFSRPYPKLDAECAAFLTHAVEDDRKKLAELMNWECDPWPSRVQ